MEHNRTSILLWVRLSNQSNKNAIELNPNRFCSEFISWYWVNHAGEIIFDLYSMVLIEKRRNIKLNVNVWLKRSAKCAHAAEHHAWVRNLVKYPSEKIWVPPYTLYGEGNHALARRGWGGGACCKSCDEFVCPAFFWREIAQEMAWPTASHPKICLLWNLFFKYFRHKDLWSWCSVSSKLFRKNGYESKP